MSKKCPECGSLNIEYLFEGEDSWCKDCSLHFPTSDAAIATVFDKISSSMDALAEKLVYERVIIKNIQINNSHSSKTRSSYTKMWKSALFPRKFFDDKQKALSATVEELKKEAKDE